jgi:hypothetical protein
MSEPLRWKDWKEPLLIAGVLLVVFVVLNVLAFLVAPRLP